MKFTGCKQCSKIRLVKLTWQLVFNRSNWSELILLPCWICSSNPIPDSWNRWPELWNKPTNFSLNPEANCTVEIHNFWDNGSACNGTSFNEVSWWPSGYRATTATQFNWNPLKTQKWTSKQTNKTKTLIKYDLQFCRIIQYNVWLGLNKGRFHFLQIESGNIHQHDANLTCYCGFGRCRQ